MKNKTIAEMKIFIKRWRDIERFELKELRRKTFRERFQLMLSCRQLAQDLRLINIKDKNKEYYSSPSRNWCRLKNKIING